MLPLIYNDMPFDDALYQTPQAYAVSELRKHTQILQNIMQYAIKHI
jgi:hypothetical protein